MADNEADNEMLKTVRAIADYQFGRGAGKALFPDSCEFVLSYTGRIRQILDGGVRIATVKADTGLLTLSVEGARRLKENFEFPVWRVCVLNEVSSFVAEGRSVFAKHVVNVYDAIRPGDEVIVVDEDDRLLATGRAVLSSAEMKEFMRGVAVEVRQGVKRKRAEGRE